jgi:hypothetical protein
VPFGKNYLTSEEEWKVWVDGVKAMRDHGLRVWIYDEDGYPSLGAGGLVLASDSSLEALEMVYDIEAKNPYIIRRCYEFTHACNNFYVARRYPNPLVPEATQKFLRLTHQNYLEHLGPQLFSGVEAFFTDEPSMMAVNLGQLREDVRKSVRVTDPLDTTKKNLPMVSWSDELPEMYKARYGEEILPALASLFSGESEKDKDTRHKFWSLLADLDKDYYYKAIRTWCAEARAKNGGKGPVSSGHGLREENPACHVPLDGNKLLVTAEFDIPGLDQLNSDPAIWSGNAWMSVFFPNSTARISGQRRVMCEMSDFDQTINGKNPVGVQQMQAASAWQMAFGVTDFNLYYTITYGSQHPDRREPAYRQYCDFVGRINSVVRDAVPDRKVLLYYPVYDLQREYIPTATVVGWRTQSELTKTLEFSFRELGANLLKAQTQFVLVDYLTLGQAEVNKDGNLRLGNDNYTSLVFPKGVILPPDVTRVVDQAVKAGVKVVFAGEFDETPAPSQLAELTGSGIPVSPDSPTIAFGQFTRDGRDIYLVVNTASVAYSGKVKVSKGSHSAELDPKTGAVSDPRELKGQAIPLLLDPMETKIFIVN